MPGRVGRLEVGEVRDRRERVVQLDARHPLGEHGLGRDRGVPPCRLVESAEQRVRVVADVRGQPRVELSSRSAARNVDRRGYASDPAEALDDVADHDDAGGQRDLLACDPGRRALAIPALEHVLEPIAHLFSQTETHREQPRDHAVRRLHRGQPIASRDQQRSDTCRATQGRLAATDVAEDEARAERVGEVAIRPQLDVVAEPGGLLMRVRMASSHASNAT